MGKTKIIATIGPATSTKEKIKELILSGCDVFRLNMSHSSYEFCTTIVNIINDLNEELNTSVAVMLDTNGPDIRIREIKNNTAFLKQDDKIRIYKDNILGDETKFSIDYNAFVDEVSIGNNILLNDGLTELIVEEKTSEYLICKVVKEGTISSKMGVHVKDVKLNIPFINKRDKEDLLFADKIGADFLAVSFVSSSEDILEINDILIEIGNNDMNIIAKIETESAVDEIDQIIKASDGIMISRGDLGIEVPVERIPGIQKSIISKCHNAGKISIVATELISSMEDTIRPTRAEVSDIANAVLDGVDAVMLSGVTTIGRYPIETMQMMEKVIVSAENDIDYLGLLDKAVRTEKQDITGEISYSVAILSSRLKCKAIVSPTMSGYTVRKISRFRPNCPILALSNDTKILKALTLNFGVIPIKIGDIKNLDNMINNCIDISKKQLNLKKNDKIIITGGYPFKEVKHTNFIKVEEI